MLWRLALTRRCFFGLFTSWKWFFQKKIFHQHLLAVRWPPSGDRIWRHRQTNVMALRWRPLGRHQHFVPIGCVIYFKKTNWSLKLFIWITFQLHFTFKLHLSGESGIFCLNYYLAYFSISLDLSFDRIYTIRNKSFKKVILVDLFVITSNNF